MLKKILVGLGDLPYSLAATQYALELAERHEASVTAVTLVDPSRYSSGPVPIGGGEAAKELREHWLHLSHDVIEQAIAAFEQECRTRKVPFGVTREQGNPFEHMVTCSRYFDLTVCGLRNLFDHGVRDEPPRELIRLIEGGVRPLLAVPAEYHKIQRVLITYSGSTESAKTMKHFAQMRLWPNCIVRVVTFDRKVEEGKQRLQNAAEYLKAHQFTAETELVDEPPLNHILTFAAGWDADLIVMGNSARRYMFRRIFGETMMNVLAHSELPLFLDQ